MQRQKSKHNKKRNTAFLYEALMKELTKNVVQKNENKKRFIVSILKEHFSKGTVLHKELSLYRGIQESTGLDKKIAAKILFESKIEYDRLPKNEIFNEQSKLINKINKSLSQNVFSNFVSDYKTLASISQMFNETTPVKERVLLEESIIENMCKPEAIEQKMVPVDNLAYKMFIKKFNDKYVDSLLKEQKELLTNYVVSFSDNGLSLKVFLNEELTRIKEKVSKCMEIEEIKQDQSMKKKTSKIMEKLELFNEKEFDQQMLGDLLKIQYFINEAQLDG